MSLPSANELFELLKSAVLEPNLTIEAIAKLLFQYRDGNLPVKQSTADMNKALGKIGIQGKGNEEIRAELCICFVHMKMWNCDEVPLKLLGVDELCKRYDLHRFDVEKDPYFSRYCCYLCPVLDIVEPSKHKNFIIQDVLVPLSGARGIKYITGSGKENSRTMIRNKAFGLESRLLRPKTLLSMIALGSPLLCGFDDSFKVTYKEKDKSVRTCTYSEFLSNHVPENLIFHPPQVLRSFVQKVGSEVSHSTEGGTSSKPLQEFTVAREPNKPVLSKRSYDETDTSPSFPIKERRFSFISEDGHTTPSSDTSSSTGDLSDVDFMMLLDLSFGNEASHAPSVSFQYAASPPWVYLYTQSVQQEQEFIPPTSQQVTQAATLYPESDIVDSLEDWAVEWSREE